MVRYDRLATLPSLSQKTGALLEVTPAGIIRHADGSGIAGVAAPAR